VQYVLSLIDRWSGPAKSASAAGTGLAGSLNAAGVAAGTVDTAAQKNAASIRTLHTELAKAETEVKQLEAAQKRLGAGGSSDIAQKKMLDEKLSKAKGKVGTINQSLVQAGGASFDTKAYDDAEKTKQKSAKDTETAKKKALKESETAEKKALNDSKRAQEKKSKEKDDAAKARAATTNGILAAGAKAALAGVGVSAAGALLNLGLGYQGVARLAGITARAQYNFRGLFKGTDSKPMLDSLDRMVGMLSPATKTGKALGDLLRGSFNAVGKAIEFVTPFAERFFAGMILGGKLARLGFTYIEIGVLKLISAIPGAAALVSKFGSGWGPFAAGAALVSGVLTVIAIKAAIVAAPFIAAAVAVTMLTSALKKLSEEWDENSSNNLWEGIKNTLGVTSDEEYQGNVKGVARALTPDEYDKKHKLGKYAQPAFGSVAAMEPVSKSDTKAAGVDVGKQLGAGMVAGMNASMPDVKAAGAQLSSAAEEGAIARAEIYSPSRRMKKKVGWQLGFGVRDGILDTQGDVQAAAETAFVPNVSASMNVASRATSGQSGGGNGRVLLIDCRGANFYGLDGASGFVQMIRATVSDQFEEVREQVGAMAEVT
jgi:hypothetical protein